MDPSAALSSVPGGLRNPLLAEYEGIVQNYLERRWAPSELSGGKFCEIVFTILDGFAKGSYPAKPKKPSNFVDACRKLEGNSNVPRSFQVLIPRMLPALYEVRNNRGVGHAGGDVDPNHMDATAVLYLSNWIMAELVRVLHGLSTEDAQELVDRIVERRIPLVWQRGSMKRVLDPTLSLKNQVTVLLASSPSAIKVSELQKWCDYKDTAYFLRLLRRLHTGRLIELSEGETTVELLPPGSKYVETVLARSSEGLPSSKPKGARRTRATKRPPRK